MRARDLDHHAADLPLGQLVLERVIGIEPRRPAQESLGLRRYAVEGLLAEIGEAGGALGVAHGLGASGMPRKMAAMVISTPRPPSAIAPSRPTSSVGSLGHEPSPCRDQTQARGSSWLQMR